MRQRPLNKSKIAMFLAIILWSACLSLLLYRTANADTVLQQTVDTSSNNADTGFQPLGNSISGVIKSVDLSASNAVGTSNVQISIMSCTDSTYSSCTDLTAGVPWTGSITASSGQHVFTVTGTGINTTLGTYYGLSISVSQQGASPLYGSNATSSLPAAGTAAFHRVGTVPCVNCGAHTSGNSAVKQLYFILYDALGPSTDTTTRIAYTQPLNGQTIATSSTATIGATGYINESDYVSGMTLKMKYVRLSDLQAAVANVDNIYTTKTIPITGSGTFSLSTTTSILGSGQYQLNTSIETPSLVNDALNFLGFGQFATLGVKTATTTTFIAVAKSGYDIFVASTTDSVSSYLASSTISMASCSAWTSFNLAECLNLLFVPQIGPIKQALNSFKDGFLSYAPWGYLTRFIVIISGNATTTLPTISIPTPLGNPNDPSYINGTFTLDPNDMLTGGGALVNSIKTTYGDGGVHKSVQDVAEPFVLIMVGLSLITYIVRDLLGMRHSHKPTTRLH